MDSSNLYMDLQDGMRKFRGPTYDALLEFSAMKRHSLLREVELRSPEELAVIVVGVSVYEVFIDLPGRKVLIDAMKAVKRKQAKFEMEKIYMWMNANLPSKVLTPVMNKRSMQSMDMRMFLSRYPLGVLPNPVFRSFVTNVKRFLLKHLFKFRRDSMLYSKPPEFPSEDQLPRFVNALGPTKQLEKNYPHLARIKHELIVNITHFTLSYCLDWICEVLILDYDRYGLVTYSYPCGGWRVGKGRFWRQEGAESLKSDPEISRKRKAEARVSVSDEDSRHSHAGIDFSKSNDESRTELRTVHSKRISVEEEENACPSTSKSLTPADQETPVMESHPKSASSHPGEALPCGDGTLPKHSSMQDDEWSEMLDTALGDPNLPTHYKTLIRCLVASNRDLRNVVTMMKSHSA